MKTLYLLRHAKAEPGGAAVSDPDRVLAKRGREASGDMGAYMKAKGYHPALALCSSSARTRETLGLVMQAADIEPKTSFQNALYLASAEQIIKALQGLGSDVPSALVVGHNPGMHHAALLLSESRSTDLRETLELKYPTCALTVMQFKAVHWHDIAPGNGALLDFVTPEAL